MGQRQKWPSPYNHCQVGVDVTSPTLPYLMQWEGTATGLESPAPSTFPILKWEKHILNIDPGLKAEKQFKNL